MKNKKDSPAPKPASKTKRVIHWFFKPREWSDWDRSKSIARFFLEMIERFFVVRPQSEEKAETFDNAVAKYNLDEASLKAKAQGLERLSYSLVAVGVFLFFYAIYQLFYGSTRGMLIAVAETGIALVLAFRYHFWSFQIKSRKLGCSFKEWLDSFSGGNP